MLKFKNITNLVFTSAIAFAYSFGICAQESSETRIDTTGICVLAAQHIESYEFQQAISLLDSCYQGSRSNLKYLKQSAYCYSKLGVYHEAKSRYIAILIIDSVHKPSLIQLASIYIKENDYKKALEIYGQLVELNPANSFYYKKSADILLKSGAFEAALVQYQKALELNAHDLDIIGQLSRIYIELELFTKADSLIALGKQQDANNTKLLLYEAKSAYKQKNYAQVISSTNRLLTLVADTSAYHLKLLGISSFHQRAYNDAIHYLEMVVAKEEDTEVIHYYLGLAYRANKDYTESVLHFELAVNRGVSSNMETYYTNLAIAYEEKGIYKESIRAYQAAYKLSEDKILLYHLARNYDAYYEDKKTALKYYEKYLDANDTGNIDFKDHSKHRITELKQVLHFEIR